MHLREYDTSQRFSAAVAANRRLTPDITDEVCELVLEVKDAAFEVAVGQHVGVLAPTRGAEHFRLYSIADVPEPLVGGGTRLRICVRRCVRVDPITGEERKGIASNFLCDRHAGDHLTVTGPYGQAFAAPVEHDATLLLIGMGTGIAPFRAFVKDLYGNVPRFPGRVVLVHGAHSGVDLLYQNDRWDDFALYYDETTFEAIRALSGQPDASAAIGWGAALAPRADEFRELLRSPKTYVYVAGLEPMREELASALAEIVSDEAEWTRLETALRSRGRWVELLY